MGLNIGLYVIDITGNRVNLSDIKGLQMLQRLLDTGDERKNPLSNIWIIFNKYDNLSDSLQNSVDARIG